MNWHKYAQPVHYVLLCRRIFNRKPCEIIADVFQTLRVSKLFYEFRQY